MNIVAESAPPQCLFVLNMASEKRSQSVDNNYYLEDSLGKRKRDENKWKRNIVKKKKCMGVKFINLHGKTIPCRTTGPDCQCRRRCMDEIGTETRSSILDSFNSISNHVTQNLYLRALATKVDVKRRRQRNDDGKQRSCSWKFKVTISGQGDIFICQNAFLSLHGIARGRLKSILSKSELPVMDGRGCHHNRPNAVPGSTREAVKGHILSFQPRESHYSRKDNTRRRYLDSDLSIASMHRQFLERYPDLKVKYFTYSEIFRTLNISFGYPRSDTCMVCDKMQCELQSVQDDECLKKLICSRKDLHLRKAEAFYTILKEYASVADNVAVISFDFQKNFPLPHLTASEVYYKRQLWFNLFGVHNVKTGEASMYVWTENVAKKGNNEVISCLLHYIESNCTNHEKLVLISDNCSGQNKGWPMIGLGILLSQKFSEVSHIFPLPGHSRLPNDRDFALIEKRRRKVTVAYEPEDWIKVVKEARPKKPFKVVDINKGEVIVIDAHRDFKNFMKAGSFVEKDPVKQQRKGRPKHRKVVMRDIRGLQYRQGLPVLARTSMTGSFDICFEALKKGKQACCPSTPAYLGPIKLKPAKLKDVTDLVGKYVPEGKRDFYKTLVSGDIADISTEEEDCE